MMTQLRAAMVSKRMADNIACTAKSKSVIDFANAIARERRLAVLPEMGPGTTSFNILPDGQAVSVSCADGSTDEDPIVRISGSSLGGKFDFTCHINEIDPENASYAELYALSEHQLRTAGTSAVQSLLRPYQTGAVSGDITQKRSDWKTLSQRPGSTGNPLLDYVTGGSSLLDYVTGSSSPLDSGNSLFDYTSSTTELLQLLQSSMLNQMQGSSLYNPSDMLSLLGDLPQNRFGL